jgi:glycosyltransferase involved in cell wall biosynthesis
VTIRVLQVIGGSQFGGAVWIVRSYVEALMEHGCSVTVCTTVEPVAEVFRAAGCAIVDRPEIVREIDPRRDIAAVVGLARVCRRGRFDVVHTHTSKGGFVGRAAARLAGVPIVLHTAHGFAFHESSGRAATVAWSSLERLAARWSDRVITVSEYHRAWAIRLGIAGPDRIVAIPNGIAPDRVAPDRGRAATRADLAIGDDQVLLVGAGRLAAQKGFDVLLGAMPDIMRRHPEVRLVLVGEGPMRAELEAQAQRSGLSSVVRFLGFRTDIGDLLAAADVVAAPSRFEGLSITLLEAMAMARPIVSTSIGSNLELLEDGRSGLLVPPDAPGPLAAAIGRFIDDPALAQACAAAARERFTEHYVEQVMKDNVWDLYRRLLEARGLLEPSSDAAA